MRIETFPVLCRKMCSLLFNKAKELCEISVIIVPFSVSEGEAQLHKVLVTTIVVFSICNFNLLNYTSFLAKNFHCSLLQQFQCHCSLIYVIIKLILFSLSQE